MGRSVSREPTTWWWENRVRDKAFRRKNGKTIYHAEKLSIDDSYEAHYGFINVFVTLRSAVSGRTQTVQDSELRYDWIEVPGVARIAPHRPSTSRLSKGATR